MKLFTWSLDYCNRRLEYSRTERGIIMAESEESARASLCEQFTSDYAYNLCVYAVPMDDLNAGTAIII